MGRIEQTFTATEGRDAGKKFLIIEMPARVGHAWATRMLLAMLSSGVEVPDDIVHRGIAGLATIAMGAIGKLPPAMVAPLLEELLDCVQSVQDKAHRKLIDDDFEEIKTIFQLQKAVFDLHVEPFISGGPSTSESPKEAEKTA